MSLSFPKRESPAGKLPAVILYGCALTFGVATGRVAGAADTYFLPDINGSAEFHSNLGLQTDSDSPFEKKTEGYVANLGGIAGIRTLRSTTEVRPIIRFQDYPERKDLKRTNEQLDLTSQYNSQRGNLRFAGQYRREDMYNAEIVDAGFDEFNPEGSVVDGTGRLVFSSATRTFVQLRPRAVYRTSQRLGIGLEGTYQAASSDEDGGEDYDYLLANGFLAWKVGLRSELSTGLYSAKYEVDNGSNTTDSQGLSLDLAHEWSDTFSGSAALKVEQTDVTERGREEESFDNWGITFGVVRRGQVDQVRLVAGRTFNPSTAGVRAEVDEIRVQYDRSLRQRWAFSGAVRGFRTRAQGVGGSGDDRDYARAEFEFRRNLTRTWYMAAGYSYTWQEYVVADDAAADNRVFIRVGYKGLPPQR